LRLLTYGSTRTRDDRQRLIDWLKQRSGTIGLFARLQATSHEIVPAADEEVEGAGSPVRARAHPASSPEPADHPTDRQDAPRRRRKPSHAALAKRHAALTALDEFRQSVQQATSAPQVECLVANIKERLIGIQGRPADRPYLSRSLSQAAAAVRRSGWPAVALALLHWAIANDAADRYILNDAIQCDLALANLPGALRTLDKARALSWANDGMYAGLIAAFSRSHDLRRAEELFEQARMDGQARSFCFASIVDAFGKARDLCRVHEFLDAARRQGFASSVCYTAAIDACGKCGNLTGARRYFEAARANGLAGPPTYTALIDAFGRAGDVANAERSFNEARAVRRLSDFSYGALLGAFSRAGHLHRAQVLFDEAKTNGFVNAHCYTIMIAAHTRAGRGRMARKLSQEAAAKGWHISLSNPARPRSSSTA
jgi:pentatricopeptide repeat protein